MNDLKFDLLNPTSESPISDEEYQFELERKIKFVEECGIEETAFAFGVQEQEVKDVVSVYTNNVRLQIDILEKSIATYYEDQQRKTKTSNGDKEKGVDVQESSTSMAVDQESVNFHAQQVNEPATSSAAAVDHHRPGKELLTRTKKLGDILGKDEYDLEEIIKEVRLWGIALSCQFVNLGIEGVISKVRGYVKLKKSRIEALKKMILNVKENVVVIGTVTGSVPVDKKPEIELVKERNQSEEAVVTGSGPMYTKPETESTAGVDVVKETNDQAAVSTTAKKEKHGFGRGQVMHQQMLGQQQQIVGAKHEDSSTNYDKPADPVPLVADPVPPVAHPVPPVADPVPPVADPVPPVAEPEPDDGPLAQYVNIAKRVRGRRKR